MFGLFKKKKEEKMNNVLSVKTHVSNGRAWAAWVVSAETTAGLKFLVGVNKNVSTVYVIRDSKRGHFENEKTKRTFFDLIDITGSPLADDILAKSPDIHSHTFPTKHWRYES